MPRDLHAGAFRIAGEAGSLEGGGGPRGRGGGAPPRQGRERGCGRGGEWRWGGAGGRPATCGGRAGGCRALVYMPVAARSWIVGSRRSPITSVRGAGPFGPKRGGELAPPAAVSCRSGGGSNPPLR